MPVNSQHLGMSIALVACFALVQSFVGAFVGRAQSGAALSGGDGTVFDTSRNAFSLPARNLVEEHRPSFFVGNSFFNQNWVAAPASVAGRDGLGPLFNARSCSTCHFKDGRSRPPDPDQPLGTMLLRISVPGSDKHGGPLPDPTYGDQIQGMSIPGVAREADVLVSYAEKSGAFADGEPYSLRSPTYRLSELGYGPVAPTLLTSARVAPAMIGMGLLEAIPESTLRQLADLKDRGDGVSGRFNRVWNPIANRRELGRFGWKAEQPSVRLQTAAAFAGDIGITSSLFRSENHTAPEAHVIARVPASAPEVSDAIFDDVVVYARTLAVPAARAQDDPIVSRGRDLFGIARCIACHVSELRTGPSDLPELANQIIHPYTDLLLHDMGEALADGRPVFDASASEWRTPPLWGLGLIAKVNGHTFLLHDGRARSIVEAVLWHGGEALPARERFRAMSKQDRAALVAFLESL
jgi:CxxC motif-containing protein (DUF1111 family)